MFEDVMAKPCKQCGFVNESESAFCAGCGTPIQQSEVSPPIAINDANPSQNTLIEQARQKITAFVEGEGSTRFPLADFQFQDVHEHIECLDVEMTFVLETKETQSTKAGIHSDEHGFETTNRSLFEEKIREAKTHSGYAETLDLLATYIHYKRYDEIDNKFSFSVRKKFYYSYTCGSCSGSGRVRCTSCSYGKEFCYSCGGNGNHLVTRQFNTESRQVSERCTSCGGSGKRTCRSCGGTAKVTCNQCSGAGNLTDIHEILHFSKPPKYTDKFRDGSPSYVKDAVNSKAGLSKILSGYAKELGGAVEIDDEKFTVCRRTNFEIPFVALNISTDSVSSDAVVFGYNTTIFTLNHFIEKATPIKGDLDKLVGINKIKNKLNPFFFENAAPIISDFMKSKIHHTLLKSAATKSEENEKKNKNKTEIHNALNRALSQDYIANALDNIETSAKTVKLWVVTKYILGTTLLTIIVLQTNIVQNITKIRDSEQTNMIIFTLISSLLVAVALTAYVIRLRYTSWLNKTGSQYLVDHSVAQNLSPSYGVFTLLLLSQSVVVWLYFSRNPIPPVVPAQYSFTTTPSPSFAPASNPAPITPPLVSAPKTTPKPTARYHVSRPKERDKETNKELDDLLN